MGKARIAMKVLQEFVDQSLATILPAQLVEALPLREQTTTLGLGQQIGMPRQIIELGLIGAAGIVGPIATPPKDRPREQVPAGVAFDNVGAKLTPQPLRPPATGEIRQGIRPAAKQPTLFEEGWLGTLATG
jgi:hypothetical protein